MKVRRIEPPGDRPSPISFHPDMTVVRGLRGAARQQLIEAIAALPCGTVPGVSGEVEVDGQVLPLDPAVLGGLGLSGDGHDNVVRSTQLPGLDVSPGRRSPRRAAEMSRDGLARRLAGARSRLADAAARRVALLDEREEARRREEAAERVAAEAAAALDEARAELAAAQAGREAAAAELEAAEAALRVLAEEPVPEEEALAQARSRHAAALEARAGAERSLEEARAGLDPGAGAVLASLDDFTDAGPAGEREGEAETDTAAEAPVPRADLLERRRQLEGELTSLADADPAPVADALAAVRAELPRDELTADARRGQDEPAPFGDDGRLWAEDDPRPDDVGRPDGEDLAVAGASAEAAIAFEGELSDANARVEQTRAALAEAQAAAAAAAELDPEVVAALEAAHAQVLAAQKRQGRLGRRARSRLEEARAAERQVLGQHGFASYAEYAMSLAPSSRFLENPAVAEARADVIAAEVALAALEAEAERAAAAAGSGALDLDGAPEGVTGGDGGHATAALHAALSDAGLVVEPTDDPAEDTVVLVALAEHWLDEHAAASARRLQLEAQLAELDADLARLDPTHPEAVAQPPVAPLSPEELAARRADAAVARAAAEERHARHAEAEARVAALGEEVDACSAEVAATAADVVAAEERVTALDRSALDAAADAVERARAALTDAETAERRAEEHLAEREGDSPGAGEMAPFDPPASFEEQLAAVTAAVEAAQAEAGLLEVELTGVERRLADGSFDEEVETATAAELEEASEARLEEIEWYLMSRLAAQRRTGAGGSVPILFDDAFAELSAEEAVRLAAAVEGLAGAVQVILLSDDDELAGWARDLGEERASVVSVGLL